MEPGYNLRARERKSIFEQYEIEEDDLCDDDEEDRGWVRRKQRERRKRNGWKNPEDGEFNGEDSLGRD